MKKYEICSSCAVNCQCRCKSSVLVHFKMVMLTVWPGCYSNFIKVQMNEAIQWLTEINNTSPPSSNFFSSTEMMSKCPSVHFPTNFSSFFSSFGQAKESGEIFPLKWAISKRESFCICIARVVICKCRINESKKTISFFFSRFRFDRFYWN